MPKRIVPLSDTKIRTAKTDGKPLTLFDGGGLYLLVLPTGGKLWRFQYRFEGQNKLLALGAYPEISLQNARQRRDETRRQVALGIDPGAVKKAQKQAQTEETETLETITREWIEKFRSKWVEAHAEKTLNAMVKDVFPWVGKRPIKELKAPELLAALRRIESRGALDTAHRVRGQLGQVFRYAVATGRAERDPMVDLRGALPPARGGHHAAIIDPKEVAALLRAIDGYEGGYVVKCALRLAPLLFVRPGELRNMEWSELDLEAASWSIPAAKMKMKEPHIVPLPKQAVTILQEIQPLTGSSQYVFPSGRSFTRAMSNNAILAALRRMGYDKDTMTGHGFRAMARTILDEVLHVNPYVIEAQLAHKVPDALGRAYNRTTHLSERVKMMQTWADYLDNIKASGVVVPFRAGTA